MSKILTVVIMLSFTIFTAAEAAQDQIHQHTLSNVKLSLWYNGLKNDQKQAINSLKNDSKTKLADKLNHVLDRIEK